MRTGRRSGRRGGGGCAWGGGAAGAGEADARREAELATVGPACRWDGEGPKPLENAVEWGRWSRNSAPWICILQMQIDLQHLLETV
jgi:hypothetical protein